MFSGRISRGLTASNCTSECTQLRGPGPPEKKSQLQACCQGHMQELVRCSVPPHALPKQLAGMQAARMSPSNQLLKTPEPVRQKSHPLSLAGMPQNCEINNRSLVLGKRTAEAVERGESPVQRTRGRGGPGLDTEQLGGSGAGVESLPHLHISTSCSCLAPQSHHLP